MTTATKQGAAAVKAALDPGPTTAQQTTREAIRLGKRWRKQALPLVALGATHGVGAASAALAGPAALLPVAAGWVGAAGAYGYAHTRTGRWERVYTGIAAVGSAMFQAGIGATGWDSGWAAATWLIGSALAMPWWVRHSEPDPDVTAELATSTKQAFPAAPVEARPSVKAERLELWAKHIAAKGKLVPESELSEVTNFEHGWKAIVKVPKPRNWLEVFHARQAIESTYDLEMNRAFVESIPGKDVKYCRLTVLEHDPLQQVKTWDGPGLDVSKGSFPAMVTADGETLNFQLWVPGEGGSHGLISGGTRVGKSTLLDLILTECAMSDRVRPMIIDGAGGASLAQWVGRVKEFATNINDAKELMRYAIELLDKRNSALIEQRQQGGAASIEPSPDQPLIPVLIDEAHEFLMADPDFVRLCERFAQQKAKYAGSLILSTQVPSVEQLGGSSALRGQLKMGTVIALRLTEGSNQHMLEIGDPMPEDLRNLPAEFPDGTKTRGLGYMMTSRKIRSRVIYLKDPMKWPIVDVPLEPALAAVPKPKLNGGDAESRPAPAQGGTTATHDDLVAHALASGCPRKVGDLMHATGLSMAQVSAALKNF